MFPRLNAIIQHPDYMTYYNKIQSLETSRKFCKHTMSHFLDVARISYIMSLEEDAHVSRELLYAAALLHDIGRHEEYLYGTPHEQASASLSLSLLESSGFTQDETTMIQLAILNHRTPEVAKNRDLSGYLYRGDKASRTCYACKYTSECNSNKLGETHYVYW